jgi:hypothetical protein
MDADAQGPQDVEGCLLRMKVVHLKDVARAAGLPQGGACVFCWHFIDWIALSDVFRC